MKLSPGKIAAVAIAVMALAYGVAEFRGPNGYMGLTQKQARVRELERENEKLRSEIDHLDKRVEQLRSDANAQDLEIRKQSDKVSPTDKVYRLNEKQKQLATAK